MAGCIRWNSSKEPVSSPLAVSLRKQMVELRDKFGDRHPNTYQALNHAGELCFEDGNLVDSLAFYEEALTLQRYYLGYAHVCNADTHYAMAKVLKSKSLNESVENYVTALGLYEFELKEIQDKSFHLEEEWSQCVPSIIPDLDANTVLESVLEVQNKIASCLNSIGNIRFEQRRFNEASTQYRKSLNIIRAAAKQAEQAFTSTGESIEVEAAGVFHSDDSSSSDDCSSTEVIEIVAGNDRDMNGVRVEITAPGGGGEMMDCSSDAGTPNKTVAVEHDRIHQLYWQALLQEADTLHNIANLHGERGEWAEAIRHYNYALHLQVQQLGEDNSIVATTLSNIGTMNHRAGNLFGALKAYKQVAKMRKNCRDSKIELADAILSVALVQSQIGLLDKAENMYGTALRITVGEVGERHIKVATIMIGMGDMYLQYKDDDEKALQLYSDAFCIFKENDLPDDHFLLKSVTKKIMDIKFKEMGGNTGGAMSAFYEVMKAVGINTMPAFHDVSDNEIGVSSLMDEMSKANVSLTAF